MTVLKRSDQKKAEDDFDLAGMHYGFGVSWSALTQRNIDVDLQCVLVDKAGAIVDCAYYNNLSAAQSVSHSGDTREAKGNGVQELIWADLQKLPKSVQLLIFVIATYSGGCLQDVENGKLHVFEERDSKEIAVFEMERSSACVDVVSIMYRADGAWKFRILDIPAESGQHFMDILPLLSQTVREFIPSAPTLQKVSFAMEKGCVLDLPIEIESILVGLGWNTADGEVDLDVSAVLLDCKGRLITAIYYGKLQSLEHGITHSGDHSSGEVEGDDEEQIIVNFHKVGTSVQHVFFVVNIFNESAIFSQIDSPYCRVVNLATRSQICRYDLRHPKNNKRGMIIARVSREPGGRWGFHAIGVPCNGKNYAESLLDLQKNVGFGVETPCCDGCHIL